MRKSTSLHKDAEGKIFRGIVMLGPVQWLLLCGGILVALIGIGTGLVAVHFRDRAVETSIRESTNNVLLIARHFDQQLGDLQGVQNDILQYMKDERISSVETYASQMSSLGIHQMMRTRLSALPYVGGINLFDAAGWLVNSSEAWPVPNINIADRPHFRKLKSDAKADLVVEPVISRVTGAWTTVFARRVVGSNGEFIGMIGRGVEPSHFENYLASLSLEPGSSISMIHENGFVLARYPRDDMLVGANITGDPLFEDVVRREGAWSGEYRDPVDGRPLLASTRRLTSYPILIVSTRTKASALSEWREQTKYQTAGAAVSAIIIAVILLTIIKQLNRQHRAARRSLARKSMHLDTAVNNITQGLLLFDARARLVLCNRRYIDMFSVSPDIVKPGCHLRDLVAHRRDTGSFVGDVDAYCDGFLRNVATGKVNDAVLTTPDGRSIQIVYKRSEDGGWASTLEDITERRRTEERIAHLAHFDTLTDLPNRLMFREHVGKALTDSSDCGRFAVLYIDIDRFKDINDTLGHAVGDELLKAVASRLQRCMHEGDFVARLGGDEFAVVQAGVVSRRDVEDLLVQIYGSLREPMDCLGNRLSTDASIGVAMGPDDGSTLELLLKRADLAMYQAKSEGRCRHRFFEPDMEHLVEARHRLEQDLREAIDADALEVQYQPIVDLADGRIVGCEALARWHHPERGFVSPADFIPVAEDTGLINRLGDWVMRTACAEASRWPRHLTIAVNVSPVQFRSSAFVLNLMSSLAASGLAPHRLELEITEAVVIHDDDTALAILHQLREIGVRIALDDFGTGYSSLSYLKRFPFDKIKIDRSFIKDVCAPDGSTSIVQAVVNIAAARRIVTTAEGVETHEQKVVLAKLGCTQMQGFLFSPAIPASQLRSMLRSAA